MSGLTKKAYLVRFERANLLDAWPGKGGKGDAFPRAEARAAAAKMEPLLRGRTVVFVGASVARAFGVKIPFYLQWASWNEGWAAVLPHPSGINRWYNEPANALCAERFMRRLAKCAG